MIFNSYKLFFNKKMASLNHKSIKAFFILYFFLINNFCIKNTISSDASVVQITTYQIPQSLMLINGNILISTTNYFYFYNSLTNEIIYRYPYENSVVISDGTAKDVILRQFSQDDKIIICFVSNILYIFPEDGQSLLNSKSLSLTASFFSMTPFKTDTNSYYFFDTKNIYNEKT